MINNIPTVGTAKSGQRGIQYICLQQPDHILNARSTRLARMRSKLEWGGVGLRRIGQQFYKTAQIFININIQDRIRNHSVSTAVRS